VQAIVEEELSDVRPCITDATQQPQNLLISTEHKKVRERERGERIRPVGAKEIAAFWKRKLNPPTEEKSR